MSREGVRFVSAGEVQDALRADHLQRALEAVGIAVMVKDHWTGTASALTDGLTRPWWEVRVPEADLARARELIHDELRALEVHAADDARAAEEEAGTAQGDGSTTSNNA
jgi:hypothetical protein